MNVFVLDEDKQLAAQYHCDKHVVKMVTETAQLLSSAYYYTGEKYWAPYKLSHANHPWALWTRETEMNWVWLCEFGIALYNEYKYRYYNRTHSAGEVILQMKSVTPSLPQGDLTRMPLCMPDSCKRDTTVASYRAYYNEYKTHLFSWTGRETPFWVKIT